MENSNGGNTNVGSIGNSIEEDIERLKLCSTNQCNICGRYEKEECMLERNRCEQHILSDYKKLQEEFREVDHECDRLEKIDFEKDMKIKELQKENEELKNQEVTARKINELLVQRYSNSISKSKLKDIIDRIDYDIKKT